MEDTRQQTYAQRVRAFKFAPLADCRRRFATLAAAPNIEWEPANEKEEPGPASCAAEQSGKAMDPDAVVEDSELEPLIEPDDIEGEPMYEQDNWLDSVNSPISDPFQRTVDQAAADLGPVQSNT